MSATHVPIMSQDPWPGLPCWVVKRDAELGHAAEIYWLLCPLLNTFASMGTVASMG